MAHRSSPSPRPRAARGFQIVRRLALVSAIALTAACALAAAELAAAHAAPPSAGTAGTAGDGNAGAGGAAAGGAICDSTTALTVIGMDNEAGSVLGAVAGPGGGTGSWIVALDGAGASVPGGGAGAGAVREAHAYPEQPGGRFGGSVGPGAGV